MIPHGERAANEGLRCGGSSSDGDASWGRSGGPTAAQIAVIPTVTADEFEALDDEVAETLIRARFFALTSVGCEPEDAVVVAVHPQVPLDAACALVSRGCPGRTALRILL